MIFKRFLATKMVLMGSIILIAISSCDSMKKTESMSNKSFDIEGHRGCRGLFPENTIPAFIKALSLRVNTLEMDLVITEDNKVVVSHEPIFRAGLSIDPQGVPIIKEDQLNHNIYKMPYARVKLYDVGSLPDPNHPDRENMAVNKPLFSDVVKSAKSYCKENKMDLPDFNIEIKRDPKHDGEFHPSVNEYVDLVLEQVDILGIADQTIIQSFDIESLQVTKKKAPHLRTALLIENEDSPEANLAKLGFTPDIYSSYFKLVDEHLINLCKSKNIAVIPWTVNQEEDINNMLSIGVDGIISDYPDRVIKLYNLYANH